MRTSSRFWIASLGKQFTSAGILRGQEQGRLRLEDPLSRFFPDAPSEKKAITILQLLTHQSGLPQRYIAQGVSDRAAAVNRILSQSLESPPGTRFSYSNDNYALAAAALEIVAGRRYETFVRDELLWPAGLRHTGFAGTGPHGSVVPARDPEPSRLARRDWGSVGSGAVFSTTRDLYVWYSALSAGRVLQPASVSLLFTPYVAIGEGASGLGWFLATAGDGIRRFSRGNDSFGPNGLIYAYPEKQAVVVILSHAGQKDEDLSFSRAALASVEKLILAEP
jgi:CubicO group peptidase (beta-lactamase class C family)